MKTARITRQTIETLMAARDSSGCTDRAVLARRLGVPYSSVCGRVRRLIADGLMSNMPGDGSLWVTEAGIGALDRAEAFPSKAALADIAILVRAILSDVAGAEHTTRDLWVRRSFELATACRAAGLVKP